MKKNLVFLLCLVSLMSTPVLAFAANVGLRVTGGGAFTFSPAGSNQWSDDMISYDTTSSNIPQIGTSNKDWNGTWISGANKASYAGKGTSDANADFGKLGVSSYAQVSGKTEWGDNVPYTYWDWSVGTSAFASFEDEWLMDLGSLNGTTGTISIDVYLDGNRTSNMEHFNTTLGLTFGNHTANYQKTYGPDISEGLFTFTADFKYGETNNIYMSLISGASSYNQWGDGGESYVNFLNTAQVTGLTFYDATGNEITGYTLTTGSGHNYAAVPSPSTVWLLGSGLMALAGFGRKSGK
ncbi:MAG: hypothetical protein WC836_11325 [Desulfobacula sp.]|jgi:hypothetical protein